MFNALQRKGIPSKFVYFPKENVSVIFDGVCLLLTRGHTVALGPEPAQLPKMVSRSLRVDEVSLTHSGVPTVTKRTLL